MRAKPLERVLLPDVLNSDFLLKQAGKGVQDPGAGTPSWESVLS